MTLRLTALLLVLCAVAAPALSASKERLVTQLDVDRVEVTTRYQGQRILLFGAVPVGSQVIVKMVSPVQEVELSHKTRIGPLWLQGGHLTVFGAPDLVYLASSTPLDRLFDFGQRETLGLTLQSALKNAVTRGDAALESDWQQAFLHLKQKHRRYLEDGQAVELKDGRLFYAHMDLPADSPLGRYRLSIYQVRNGKVVRRQEATLEVQEVSLESWVSRMVHDHPWLFGVFFTLGVMLLGFVLGVMLRPPRAA